MTLNTPDRPSLEAVHGIPLGTTFVSPGRTVTEADIVSFAGLSGDFNELHTNEEFMQATPYGRRIAHGLLILAIQAGLALRALPPLPVLAFLAVKDWNFKKPVFIGDTIHVRVTLAEARPTSKDPRQTIVTWKREVVNQNGVVVQDGTTVVLIDAAR